METEKELLQQVKFGVDSVYAVTGVTDGTEDGAEKIVTESTITSINNSVRNTPNNGVYTWNQLSGQKASSTGNIYGIYDLSGGSYEQMSAYIANGHSNLKTYGASIAYNGNTLKTTSTKYTTVYPHDSSVDNTTKTDENAAKNANYAKNKVIYGDAIRETSTAGIGNASWYGDESNFLGLSSSFLERGGVFNLGSLDGLFRFRSE